MINKEIKQVPLKALCATSSFLSRKMGRLSVDRLNFDTNGQSRFNWAVSLPFFQFVRAKSDMQVDEKPIQPGKGLFLASHVSNFDPFWASYLIAEITHRTVRTWAKKSLTDPDYQETAKAKANRTQKDKFGGLLGKLYKHSVVAPYMRGFDPVAAVIGGQNRQGIRQTREAFKQGQLILMFPQGHRRPPGDLLSFLDGAAYLVLTEKPNLPIYFLGMSGTDKGVFARKTIKMDGPVTLEQIQSEIPGFAAMNSRAQLERVGLYIVDRIAKLVQDEKHKSAWTNGRWLMKEYGLARNRLLLSIPVDSDLSLTRKLFVNEYPKHPDLTPSQFLEYCSVFNLLRRDHKLAA